MRLHIEWMRVEFGLGGADLREPRSVNRYRGTFSAFCVYHNRGPTCLLALRISESDGLFWGGGRIAVVDLEIFAISRRAALTCAPRRALAQHYSIQGHYLL